MTLRMTCSNLAPRPNSATSWNSSRTITSRLRRGRSFSGSSKASRSSATPILPESKENDISGRPSSDILTTGRIRLKKPEMCLSAAAAGASWSYTALV